jgi:hypothetical protein
MGYFPYACFGLTGTEALCRVETRIYYTERIPAASDPCRIAVAIS